MKIFRISNAQLYEGCSLRSKARSACPNNIRRWDIEFQLQTEAELQSGGYISVCLATSLGRMIIRSGNGK